jgi:hypothetical protein
MRKTIKTPRFFYLVLILVITLACNLPLISNTGGTAIATATQLTQTSQSTNTVTPVTPSQTSTITVPPFTETIAITNTATAVPNTPTSTTPPQACNKAQFISDVNYPDGAIVIINANFTKTWRLQNTGTCDWTSGYKIIFNSGDRIGAPDETVLTTGNIPSGATADISVDLKAPGTVGNYKGYFKLKSPDNVVFGIGNSGADAFWVEINADKLQILKPAYPLYLMPTNTPTIIFKIVPKPKVTLKFP